MEAGAREEYHGTEFNRKAVFVVMASRARAFYFHAEHEIQACFSTTSLKLLLSVQGDTAWLPAMGESF